MREKIIIDNIEHNFFNQKAYDNMWEFYNQHKKELKHDKNKIKLLGSIIVKKGDIKCQDLKES